MDADIKVTSMPEKEKFIAQLEACSERLVTPCADGDLVWHRWGSGPPVVLLHGGTGSWTHWARNVAALAEAHTVLAPDMPGSGDSASLPKGDGVPAIAGIVANGIARLEEAERNAIETMKASGVQFTTFPEQQKLDKMLPDYIGDWAVKMDKLGKGSEARAVVARWRELLVQTTQ